VLHAAIGQLIESGRVDWQQLTDLFPAISIAQKRQFLRRTGWSVNSHLVWSLIFAGNRNDGKAGLRRALLSKQILLEAARQESHALVIAVTSAAPEWLAALGERDRLRNQYATLALQGMPDEGVVKQPGSSAVDYGAVRSVTDRIERLEPIQQCRGLNMVRDVRQTPTRLACRSCRDRLKGGRFKLGRWNRIDQIRFQLPLLNLTLRQGEPNRFTGNSIKAIWSFRPHTTTTFKLHPSPALVSDQEACPSTTPHPGASPGATNAEPKPPLPPRPRAPPRPNVRPHWLRLEELIGAALQDVPEARNAIADAIRDHANGP
jgi:hypothetical protein